MSLGTLTPLAKAKQVADYLADLLRPGAHRLEIAGSIRRRVPSVRDIELVIIPRIEERPGGQGDIFGGPGVQRSYPLHEIVSGLAEQGRINPIKPGTRELLPDPKWEEKAGASYWRLFIPKAELQVDVFLCTPETWGCCLAIRTGSAEFSQALVDRYYRRTRGRIHNLRVHPPCPEGSEPWCLTDQGYALGEPFETLEEADVFRVCGFEWVEPYLRHGRGDLVERRGAA